MEPSGSQRERNCSNPEHKYTQPCGLGEWEGARKPHFLLLQSSAQGVTLNYDTLNVPATQACSASAPEERKNHDEGEIALGNAVPVQM